MTHPLSPRALLMVAAGGAGGALARYGLSRAFPVDAGTFPTTTFVINITGALALAFLLETLLRRGTAEHWLRLVVGVGALGAFTTFSTMATEIAVLWRDDHPGLAVAYATLSLAAGVAAVFAGLLLAGWRGASLPADDES